MSVLLLRDDAEQLSHLTELVFGPTPLGVIEAVAETYELPEVIESVHSFLDDLPESDPVAWRRIQDSGGIRVGTSISIPKSFWRPHSSAYPWPRLDSAHFRDRADSAVREILGAETWHSVSAQSETGHRSSARADINVAAVVQLLVDHGGDAVINDALIRAACGYL